MGYISIKDWNVVTAVFLRGLLLLLAGLLSTNSKWLVTYSFLLSLRTSFPWVKLSTALFELTFSRRYQLDWEGGGGRAQIITFSVIAGAKSSLEIRSHTRNLHSCEKKARKKLRFLKMHFPWRLRCQCIALSNKSYQVNILNCIGKIYTYTQVALNLLSDANTKQKVASSQLWIRELGARRGRRVKPIELWIKSE